MPARAASAPKPLRFARSSPFVRWFDLLVPPRLNTFQATNMSRSELAVVYATLILNDDGVEVSVRLQGACCVLDRTPGCAVITLQCAV